jgi:hypothetical protein
VFEVARLLLLRLWLFAEVLVVVVVVVVVKWLEEIAGLRKPIVLAGGVMGMGVVLLGLLMGVTVLMLVTGLRLVVVFALKLLMEVVMEGAKFGVIPYGLAVVKLFARTVKGPKVLLMLAALPPLPIRALLLVLAMAALASTLAASAGFRGPCGNTPMLPRVAPASAVVRVLAFVEVGLMGVMCVELAAERLLKL